MNSPASRLVRSSRLAPGTLRGAALWIFIAVTLLPSLSAQTLYWDRNGATAGAGVTPTGNWNTAGAANWSTSALGTVATANWTSGRDAVFSAGTDATGTYTVTLGASMNVGNLTFQEGTPTITANTLTFNRVGGSTVDVASGRTATVNSILGGSVALTKTGAGTFVTGGSGSNTHSGAVTINGGVFEIAKTAYVGGINNSAAVTVAGGATLRLNGSAAYTQETIGSLSGAGTVTNVGAAAVNFVISGAASTTFSGTISDGANDLILIKNTGAGTLTLSGTNTYDGATTISTGAINIQNASALGSTAAGTTVASGAALELQNNIAVGAETLSLAGTGLSNNGALRNVSGTNSFAGAVTLSAASEIQSDAGSLSLAGAVNAGNLNLTVDGAGTTSLSGVVGLGTGSLVKNGSGTLNLTGTAANTFTGALAVNDGTVQLAKTGAVNAVGGTSVVIGDGVGGTSTAQLTLGAYQQIRDDAAVTVAFDGRLNLNNFSERIDTIAGTGLIDLSTSGFLTVGANGGSSSYDGTVTGSGTLIKEGAGSLTFNSNISYTGNLTLAGGTLALNGTSLTLGTLHITGNSILDFGNSSASILNATTFIIDPGASLTITNWVHTVDFFYATNWTGGTVDVRNAAPMNQITFTGNAAADTVWQSWDRQITPAPEPATYGLIFIGAALGLVVWQRRRATVAVAAAARP